jgi:hypothetical protein
VGRLILECKLDFYGTNSILFYGECDNAVSVSAGVKGCSSNVHGFCISNAAAAILAIATLVLVMWLVNFLYADFMCKARRVDWVWE